MAGGDKGAGRRPVWREYAEALAMAVLLALFIRGFVVQAFKIPSGSMLPTLEIGDHLLVNKFLYGIRVPFWGKRVVSFAAPERDDVVVFVYPQDRSKDFIKRVTGLPGETVELRDRALHINGEPVADAHAHLAGGATDAGRVTTSVRSRSPMGMCSCWATTATTATTAVFGGPSRSRTSSARPSSCIGPGTPKG